MASFWQSCCGQGRQHDQVPSRTLPIAQNPPMPPPAYTTGFDAEDFVEIDPSHLPPPSYTTFDPHPPGCNCPIHTKRVSRPTIIELFQSQGCNSCPPTSSNLQSVLENSNDPNLLVLDYHVTYWDHLGWKDVFGKDEFNQRQWDYARRRGDSRAYTPQVVVNGVSEGVGLSPAHLQDIIKAGQKARKGEKWAQVEVTFDRKLSIKGPRDLKGIVTVVTYDPRLTAVNIKRGENLGKKLLFSHVVRKIEQLEDWRGGEQLLDLPSSDDMNVTWRRAALVQQGPGGPIIGAGKI
jgi:hypothetical protein